MYTTLVLKSNNQQVAISLMFIILPGLNVKIIAFEVANYAVEKKKPEKIQACLASRSSPELCDTVAGLKLANWELGIKFLYPAVKIHEI